MNKTLLLTVSLAWLLARSATYSQLLFEDIQQPIPLRNVTYGHALDYAHREVALQLDLLFPSLNRQQRYPLVVLIHGGGFVNGNRQDMEVWALPFVQRGFVVATVSYRLGYMPPENLNNCNFINTYPCMFAADTAEWYRAYYRAVQDVKGAIRFLVNRAEVFRIDPEKVFLLGESAGGFTALGVAFLDTPEEKPLQTGDWPPVKVSKQGNLGVCDYQQLPESELSRPDLGSIEGDIEWPSRPYTIRGVAHLYGGMFSDLLQHTPAGKHKPIIYQFHKACDLVVPFKAGRVYSGISWCLANCWGCAHIAHTPHVWGSEGIWNWNQTNGYGYAFINRFFTTPFPNNCFLFQHNCFEQVSVPCHAPGGFSIQEVIDVFRQQALIGGGEDRELADASWAEQMLAYPNPFSEALHLQSSLEQAVSYRILTAQGSLRTVGQLPQGAQVFLPTQDWPPGVYFLHIQGMNGRGQAMRRLVKID